MRQSSHKHKYFYLEGPLKFLTAVYQSAKPDLEVADAISELRKGRRQTPVLCRRGHIRKKNKKNLARALDCRKVKAKLDKGLTLAIPRRRESQSIKSKYRNERGAVEVRAARLKFERRASGGE